MSPTFLLLVACSDYGLTGILDRIRDGRNRDAPVDSEDPLEAEGLCFDADQDGFLAAECGGLDCDDADAAVYPGAPEVCDGLDNDCDGDLGSNEVDQDGDGTPVCAGDCDDTDPWWNREDHDGDGVSTCSGDCWDDDDRVRPIDSGRTLVFVEEGGSGDGSRGAPFGQIGDALANDTLVCVLPGVYEPVKASSLAGLELMGPADGSAVVDGVITFQNVNDSHVVGLSANSFNSTNSYSDASSYNLLEWLELDCETELLPPAAYGAVYFGLGDRENVLRDSVLTGCTYGVYLNGSQANERHLVEGNTLLSQRYPLHFNWNHRSVVMNNLALGEGSGLGAFSVDAYAKNDLILGNTAVGNSGAGLYLDGPGSGSMWGWANLVVDAELAGVVGQSGHTLGYSNLVGNGQPSQVATGSNALVESLYDDRVQGGGGYASTRNRTAPVPEWSSELDVDRDGDDDRGDTLCVVGAWGEGNPLFAPHPSVSGSTLSWTLCDGDGDEEHLQASWQVQVADEPFPYQPAPTWDSGEVQGGDTSTSLPTGGWVRVRVRDESGAWSAWSDGLDHGS